MKILKQEELEFRIEELNEFYRIGEPRVSDQEYDQLVGELKQKHPNSLLLQKAVIEQPKEDRKQKLPIPMFSLNKLKSVEEILNWLRSNNISEDELLVITPKFDGISLVVEDIVGNCWTRGDGEYGQKSNMHYASLIKGGYSKQITSFGEAIISKKNWEEQFKGKINPYSGEPYKVARNTVAGFFNAEPREELKYVDYIRYGCDTSEAKCNQIGLLNSINTVECKFVFIKVKEFYEFDIEMIKEALDVLYKDWSKDYQIDGLVIDINSSELRQKLGREENMNPKYARAYKNPDWSGIGTTTVIDIIWNVSKQGKLKPVIKVEPIEVSGVTIRNVTGFNARFIQVNKIKKSSIVVISRKGDVIPGIIKVNGECVK